MKKFFQSLFKKKKKIPKEVIMIKQVEKDKSMKNKLNNGECLFF